MMVRAAGAVQLPRQRSNDDVEKDGLLLPEIARERLIVSFTFLQDSLGDCVAGLPKMLA